MKKIKFIPLFLIAVAFIATSCAIDDDDAVVPRTIITKTVSVNGTDIYVSLSDTPYNLAVNVDVAFGTNALVEYTIDDELNGGGTISHGSTSGNLPIDVSVGGVYTVTLTNVSVLFKPSNVNAVIDSDNNTVRIIVLPFTPPPADPDALQVVLAWDNMENNDLDLWITDDPPANAFEASQSITPFENVSFSNTYPDGTYNILPRDWFSVDDVVGIMVAVVHPDGTVEVFTGSIDAGTDYNYFLKFVKEGDTYTLTQVPTGPVF